VCVAAVAVAMVISRRVRSFVTVPTAAPAIAMTVAVVMFVRVRVLRPMNPELNVALWAGFSP